MNMEMEMDTDMDIDIIFPWKIELMSSLVYHVLCIMTRVWEVERLWCAHLMPFKMNESLKIRKTMFKESKQEKVLVLFPNFARHPVTTCLSQVGLLVDKFRELALLSTIAARRLRLLWAHKRLAVWVLSIKVNSKKQIIMIKPKTLLPHPQRPGCVSFRNPISLALRKKF